MMVRATPKFSRREREILDIIYARGSSSAADVRAAMRDPPTDAAVRSTLRILVEKGHLRIQQVGPRYEYSPTAERTTVQRSELRRLVRTFFGGSTEGVLAALLDIGPGALTAAQRRRLKRLIDEAAKEGR